MAKENILEAIGIIIELEFRFMDTDAKISKMGHDLTEFLSCFVTAKRNGITRSSAIAKLLGIDEYRTGKTVYENLYEYRKDGETEAAIIIKDLIKYRAPDENILESMPEENRKAAAAILIEIQMKEYEELEKLESLGDRFDFSDLTYMITHTENRKDLSHAIALILGMKDSGVVYDLMDAARRENVEDIEWIIERMIECKDDTTEITITLG